MNILHLIITFLLINKSSQRLGYDDEIYTLPPEISATPLMSSQAPPHFAPPWWSWRRWLWKWRWGN